MVKNAGRNDPCPCGSGKKYKACHGAAGQEDIGQVLAYGRIRELDAKADKRIFRYADEQFGEEEIQEVWRDFLFSDDLPEHPDTAELDFFRRWLLYSWCPDGENSLPELFLEDEGSRLDPALRRFIEAIAGSPFSFLQVLQVNPGTGFTVRDLLRMREFLITEHTASRTVEPGWVLYARAVELDGVTFLMGSGPCLLPPRVHEPLIGLREELLRELPPGDRGLLNDPFLIAYEEDLRDFYFEMEDRLLHTTPELRNSDGDPLVLITHTYSIPSFDEAFRALKDLEQKLSGAGDDELLARAERDAAGRPVKLVVDWLGKGKKGTPSDTMVTLGSLTIGASELEVNVNSEKRSARIRKEIGKRLAGGATLLRTESTTQAGIQAEPADAARTEGKETTLQAEQAELMKDPEVQAALTGMLQRHWDSWPDMKIPALRNMTPRQAARDPVGRELLETLLLEFEARNREQKDQPGRPDVEKLRKELGMPKQ